MLRRVVKLTAIFLVLPLCGFLLGAAVSGVQLVRFLKDASAYRHALNLPDSIDELYAVQIGGVEQWIQIRGHNKNAPVLLYLHGGPGGTAIRFSHEFQRPWEEYFVVVNWDQRGCGKSYLPIEEVRGTMNLQQALTDTEEVIEHVRQKLGKDKIFIVGQSWGSVLGANMAKRHPEWLYAYVGMGQFVCKLEHERDGFEQALAIARQDGDRATLEALSSLDRSLPYPDRMAQNQREYDFSLPEQLPPDFSIPTPLTRDVDKFSEASRQLLNRHGMMTWYQLRDAEQTSAVMKAVGLNSHTLSFSELWRTVFPPAYDQRPDRYLYEYAVRTDLKTHVGFEYEVPIFFFTGAHDLQTSKNISTAYFERIVAPRKELIVFENSAHGMVLEEPGKLLIELVTKVLPLATEGPPNPES